MKKSVLLVSLLISSLTFASSIPLEHTISSITVEEVEHFEDQDDSLIYSPFFLPAEEPKKEEPKKDETKPTPDASKTVSSDEEDPKPESKPEPKPEVDKVERASKIIAAAKDFVALGEAFYELIKKGRPSNVTNYEPVSVLPVNQETKKAVDIFDMEGFGMPTERKYTTKIRNGFGSEVVSFQYMVIFSHGGQYDGKGKWISSASIIPVSIKSSFGWDTDAIMKVTGMMNHGTKADPVAGLTLTIKYAIKSIASAFECNDTIHLTGKGDIKVYSSL